MTFLFGTVALFGWLAFWRSILLSDLSQRVPYGAYQLSGDWLVQHGRGPQVEAWQKRRWHP